MSQSDQGDGNRAPSPSRDAPGTPTVTAFYPPNLARASGTQQLPTSGQGAHGFSTPGQYRPVRPPTPPPSRPPGVPPQAPASNDRPRGMNQIVPRHAPPLPHAPQQRPPGTPQQPFAPVAQQGGIGQRPGTAPASTPRLGTNLAPGAAASSTSDAPAPAQPRVRHRRSSRREATRQGTATRRALPGRRPLSTTRGASLRPALCGAAPARPPAPARPRAAPRALSLCAAPGQQLRAGRLHRTQQLLRAADAAADAAERRAPAAARRAGSPQPPRTRRAEPSH